MEGCQVGMAIMYQPALATVSSNKCSQMHVQIKHSLIYQQDLIHTLAGIFVYLMPAKVGIESCS